MLRRLSVRGKILAALAVPVLVLFLAAAVFSAESITSARNASQASALVDALAAQDAAGTEVAAERTYAVLDSYGVEGAEELMMAQRDKTDKALDIRDRRYQALATSALDERVREALDQTIADRSQLTSVRNGIDRSGLGEIARTTLYSGLITSALEVPRTLADTTLDRDLAQYLNAYVVLDELLAQQALEQPVAGTVLADAQTGEDTASANQAAAILITKGDALAVEAGAAVRALPGDLTLQTPGATYTQLRGNVAGSRPASAPATQAAEWSNHSQEDRDATLPVRDEVRTATADKAADLAAAATTRAVITIIATLAAVALSVFVGGLIARAIVNPLRRLTDAAEDVRDQLPRLVEQVAVPGQGPGIDLAPISVESTDEVGQLATAFNDVNQTTIKVAREQAALRGSIAEMFVNVARRDQVLLNRQLAFLDDLERSEEDPGTLSNLFRLDHLATRMRRNAESLLVLAGIDSGRRVRQPMPASDVIRTASSEIELYDRVRLNLVVDPLMLGHNALNAAHLLAEILENATMFSEPHTPVEVTTGRDEQFVHVTIRDHGLGMTPEEIVEANRKVATHAASDVVGAQRLGLFVVGRLADRLGARVRFEAGSDGTGTQVTVSFPGALFVPDSNVPLPQPTDPLETGTQAAAHELTGTGVLPALPAGTAAPVAAPPTAPAPAVLPAATSSFPSVEPEAPVAVPVDLEALTDGTTQTGMPRRRSRTVDPAAAAPSASFASGPQTGAIVLPPLATPALPDQLPSAEDAWMPPAEVAELGGGALPSRSRTSAAPVEPVSAEIPVLDVSTRSTLFSSFRPVGDRPATDNPVELPAAPEVTAVDIPLVGEVGVTSTPVPQDTWAPQEPVQEQVSTWASQAAVPEQVEAWAPEVHEDQPWAGQSEQTWTPAQPVMDDATRIVAPVPAGPVDEATVVRRPLAQRPVQDAPSEAHADTFVPAAAVVADQVPDVPVVAASGDAQDAADEIPAELTFEALPRFEELMADLPTRRSLRESQARKRGIFGRRPRTSAMPQAPQASGPSREALASLPVAAPASTATPLTLAPPPEPVPASDPVAPARASAFAPRVEQPVADRAAAYEQGRAEESAYGPATAVQETSVLAPVRGPAPVAQPSAPVEPVYAAPAEPAQARAAQSGAWAGTGADAAPTAAGYGPPAPLVRRPVPDSLEPLAADYISDSVEARSDWMASAVLYEEMSTLLQGSTDFQEATLADSNNGTYQPLKVDSTATSGLARRSRGDQREGYVDRFTASIDRDPEQLRARLSAFQSATARGRVEGQDETSSTWTPQGMDYVPDSAPQAR